MFEVWCKEVGEILGEGCELKGVTILVAIIPDHVYMYVSTTSKQSVSMTSERVCCCGLCKYVVVMSDGHNDE